MHVFAKLVRIRDASRKYLQIKDFSYVVGGKNLYRFSINCPNFPVLSSSESQTV